MSFYFKLLSKYREKVEGNLDYTPQFQVRSDPNDPESSDGLAMRIADPLWMLGRQWQFGEFIGEDNGSPIGAQIHYRKSFASLKRKGSRDQLPLEMVVERVQEKALDLKTKVRIGKQFEQLIRENGVANAEKVIQDLRDEFSLTHEKWDGYELTKDNRMDDASYRFFNLMRGKVIDGGELINNIGRNAYPSSKTGKDYAVLEGATTQLKVIFNNYFESPRGDTWDAYTLSHQFSLKNKTGGTLEAKDYQSGHLDWYSFDESRGITPPSGEPMETDFELPVNVSFASMPDKRLFSFEDSKIDLSMMDVKTGDLLKMMILHFALVSGSDWYTIPLEMEMGDICWIDQIIVRDVFGVCTKIENDGKKGARLANGNALGVWDMFKIRNNNPREYNAEEHFLFLAPAASKRLESAPIEEVLFVRDEYANMIWAIEQRVADAMGNPKDGFDLHLELYGPFQSPDDIQPEGQLPQFRLANTVPSNWIPYLPKHVEGSNKEIELKRARMLRNEAADEPTDEPTDIDPLTHLVQNDLVLIREEAIPKAGVRLQLTKQRIRWTDGKTYVWIGRNVKTGKGEGNSGLRFDYLKNT